MADREDGSIIINTKMDNKDFERGSKELLDMIKSLKDQVNGLGGDIKNAVSGFSSGASSKEVKALGDSIASLDKSVQSLASKMSGLGKAIGSGVSSGAKEAKAAVDEVKASAEEAQEAAKNVVSSDNKASMKAALEQQYTEMQRQMQDLAPAAEKAASGSEEAIAEFETKINEAAQTVQTLREDLEAFGNTEFRPPEFTEALAEYQQLEERLASLRESAAEDRKFGATDSVAIRDLNYWEPRLVDRMMELNTIMQEIQDKSKSGDEISGYDEFIQKLDEAEDKLQTFRDTLAEVNSEEVDAPDVEETEVPDDTIAEPPEDAEAKWYGIRGAIQQAAQAYMATGSIWAGVGSLAKSALEGIASAALRAAAGAARLAAAGLAGILRGIGSAAADGSRPTTLSCRKRMCSPCQRTSCRRPVSMRDSSPKERAA